MDGYSVSGCHKSLLCYLSKASQSGLDKIVVVLTPEQVEKMKYRGEFYSSYRLKDCTETRDDCDGMVVFTYVNSDGGPITEVFQGNAGY